MPSAPSTPAPAAPAPTAPASPRARAGGSTPGPSGPTAPKLPPSLPAIPGTGPVGSGEPVQWRLWWEHNRDPYLQLRSRVRLRQRPSDDGNFYLGQGSGREALDLTVRADQLSNDVLPTLVQALSDRGSAQMRRRSLLAFAKLPADLCAEEQVDRFRIFETYLADPDLAVSRTAAVCLGLMGGPQALDTLEHLLMGCDVGQKLIARNHVSLELRVNAAYALGLAGSRTGSLDERRFVLHFLEQAIETDGSASPDLASACVAAIGVVPMPVKGGTLAEAKHEPLSESREAQLAVLLEIVEDDDQRRITRAHAVTALGRLLAAEGSEDLVERELVARKLIRRLVATSGEPREVRQSIALALGQVADADGDELDARIRKALQRATGDSDQLTRYFAMIALGQAAGRAGDAESDVYAGNSAARDHLVQILARGKSTSRPWAALALGVLGHGMQESGTYPSEDVSRALAEVLRETRNPETVGAIAIALGLRGDGQYRGLLEQRLAKLEGQEATRSEVALAMGLLGAAGSKDALRELYASADHRPGLIREASIARALLGDDNVGRDLVADLAEAKTLGDLIGIAGALSFVGESRTVEPITAAFQREDTTKLGRSYLVATLGEICEESALPWTATYSVGVNYGAATETLERGRDAGLLNLD